MMKMKRGDWEFPTKYFFPICIDNFFENPDEIRKLGLSLEKKSELTGRWPGKRSAEIVNFDKELQIKIIEKILSCYFDLEFQTVFRWAEAHLYFQDISNFDENKNSVKNRGWIHRDTNHWDKRVAFSGLIYLTPDIDLNAGTSIYQLKKDRLPFWEPPITMKKDQVIEGDYSPCWIQKGLNYTHKLKDEILYEKTLLEYEENFIETIRFQNVYNRLIIYDTSDYHRANSFYSEKESRLTLVFFIKGIEYNGRWPLERIN